MKYAGFLLKRFVVILMMPFVLSFSGCIYLVVGGIGALGGYVVSPDTVEGLTENDKDTVWQASMEVVRIMGKLDQNMKDSGVIHAEISGAQVEIAMETLSKNSVRLQVKARKNFLPKISVAQDVFVKIMSYMNE